MITFTNLTGANEIGANSYLVEFGRSRVLLDCGTHPKKDGVATLPDLDKVAFDSLETIFLSHAHLDHSGGLPVVMREQPKARVLMTDATRDLVEALLHNSVNVMTAKKQEENVTDYPLYTHRELDTIHPRWETVNPGRPFHFSEKEDVTCEFYHAGHILGAVGMLFNYQGHRLLYTGDIHFEDQTITKAASLPTENLDTVVIETTRGAFDRAAHYSRASETVRLAESINTIIDRGGAVLIPIFAMGKTQELLIILHELKKTGQIPNAPVHIGGLSTKMTNIFDKLADRSHRHYAGFKIMQKVELMVSSSRKGNRQLEYNPGSIYALSSGMMMEHTLSNQFARYFLENPRAGILFVGYADPESPSGKILSARPGDAIKLNHNAPAQALKCSVDRFDFSGHATREAICDYLVKVKPKNIILVHGDENALNWFRKELAVILPKSKVIVPPSGQKLTLA